MRRTATSAAWPLNVIIASTIEAEVTRAGSLLGELLDTPPVWSAERDPSLSLASAYIVLAASQENDGPGTFTRIGATNAETVDIWTADLSKKTALQIHGECRRLFNRVPLVVDGYGTVRGSWELIISMLDPSREQYHAQCRYTAVTLNPAT